jgi:hypothetical protein
MTALSSKDECEDREPDQSEVISVPVNSRVSLAGLGNMIYSPLVCPVIGLGSS